MKAVAATLLPRAYGRRTASFLATALMALSFTAVLPVPAAHAAPTRTDYMLAAHPDDEYEAFGALRWESAATYKIIIYMTRGEETGYCYSTSDVAPETHLGPYGYQGPHAPFTPSYNYGERHPATGSNTTSPVPAWNPWTGRWTGRCIDGRMQGTVRFLNHLGTIDSTMPANLTFVNNFFGLPTNGASPRRIDDGQQTPINNYATVYRAQNGMGAAVFFDMGDGDLSVSEVRWALETTVAQRANWGLPVYNGAGGETLSSYHRTPLSGCDTYVHVDHQATYDALSSYDAPGADRGRSCGESGLTHYIPSTLHDPLFQLAQPVTDLSARQGMFQQHYGWLMAHHWGIPTYSGTFGRAQMFHTR